MQDLLDTFNHYLHHERDASPHTRKNYLADMRHFFLFAFDYQPSMPRQGAEAIKAVTVELIRSYLAVLLKKHHPASVARKLASLRTFLHLWVFRV